MTVASAPQHHSPPRRRHAGFMLALALLVAAVALGGCGPLPEPLDVTVTPVELGNLTQLKWLDIRLNQFSGCVPGSLQATLTFPNSNLGSLQFCDN